MHQLPPGSEKEGRDCSCKQERHYTQETRYKKNYPGSSSGSLSDRKRKEDSMFYIYLPPINQVTEEYIRDLLEQLPAPMILLGDFNIHNHYVEARK